MDEGAPIAYTVLEAGVPVLTSDGEQIGTVQHVIAAPEKDIFDGLVIDTKAHGKRFVDAEHVGSIHEHGVDLRIDAATAENLPAPAGAAPVYDDDEATQTKWSHIVRKYTARSDWHRED